MFFSRRERDALATYARSVGSLTAAACATLSEVIITIAVAPGSDVDGDVGTPRRSSSRSSRWFR